ncbi:glucocorticoid receptor-like (DNA-binding domain) [Basidiobolus meristosporus CBS 931.73]|uniref:Glucocorticoid receptor-like (DNA-binding domain) n=1 Tax=Basidiobolus meristosporus CBS 931.73 TaxID=1314790 RepID=A0A1Y1Y6B4_9FUNG|nr:glucocorticoid receptor-like (DNA-binding domain) [Basidiobolus meristosporus CBS 931.73]|eukprot:ORX93533.1 glucocorticoid receptor-like (DNA-binding domain) [Basidiobolus meristosporus CBS 931.73]
MSLRAESLRSDPEPEAERDDSDGELTKLEDEDMKYIRDKRSLLSSSRSKYQKRTRNGSSQPRRCHACNTTETPEWRRGPDGARTLCNACGLHYAKLTRKRTLAAAGSSEDKEEPNSTT